MCGRLGVSGQIVVPGSVLQFSAGKRGKRIGVWGIPGAGKLIHNARLESLEGYWRHIKGNRGLVPVNSFIEPEGPIIRLKQHDVINLGLIYDDNNRFAIVTQPSVGIVAGIHPRMPIVVPSYMRERWLENGEYAFNPDSLTVLGNAGPDTNQF